MVNREEYEICRKRGHDSLIDMVPGKWSQCKYCGMWLLSKRVIEEREDDPPVDERSRLDRLQQE
jgi:hypothetical protein